MTRWNDDNLLLLARDMLAHTEAARMEAADGGKPAPVGVCVAMDCDADVDYTFDRGGIALPYSREVALSAHADVRDVARAIAGALDACFDALAEDAAYTCPLPDSAEVHGAFRRAAEEGEL